MSSSRETESCDGLEAALRDVQDKILRLISGFDCVQDGNLAVLDSIEGSRSQLVNYPQVGCASHEDIVAGINWSIREHRHPGIPEPRQISVAEAIEIAKALDHRRQLAEKYIPRFTSTTTPAFIANDDLKLAKKFHNRFLEKLSPGRS
jgi:hypothetical protein